MSVAQAEHRAPAPAPRPRLGDVRFRSLLSEAEWARLPAAIRRRFAKRVAAGDTVVYTGRVTETVMNRAGFVLAQLARVIGGPLPTARDSDVPAIVSVTEDRRCGGQIWTRLYARRDGFPQVIHSSKRFAGPTGLEEHVGCGIGMTLTVATTEKALIFRSKHYFIELGPAWARARWVLPAWLTPGAITDTHTEIDSTRFAFTLDIVHPWLGRLIHQRADFEETPS